MGRCVPGPGGCGARYGPARNRIGLPLGDDFDLDGDALGELGDLHAGTGRGILGEVLAVDAVEDMDGGHVGVFIVGMSAGKDGNGCGSCRFGSGYRYGGHPCQAR